MALADGHGLPIAASIGNGSRHDVTLVEQTLDAAFTEDLPERLIGDEAFDSAKLARECSERGVELIAPKRRRSGIRKQDGRPLRRYRRRWKVERLFAWLKRYRRLAVRYERKAENFLGFLHVACIVLLTRRLGYGLSAPRPR
jgi:transposase